jgi:hypothetical protein
MNRTVPSTGPLQDVAGRLRWQTCIAPVHTGTGKIIFSDDLASGPLRGMAEQEDFFLEFLSY